MSSSPRIYGMIAIAAPTVAIIRRGPSEWCHVGRWDLASDSYEPGAWYRGTIYPQKCDLSPDGEFFLYSAMKVGLDWASGEVYVALSRLPWLTALAAWNAGTTYTRGFHFVSGKSDSDPGVPDVGTADPCRCGIALTRPVQFPVERRRGWAESPDTVPRDAGGHWDEQRRVEMVKPHPVEPVLLHVAGRYAAFRVGEPDDGSPVYWLSSGEEITLLEDVQWADWDNSGRLLVATTDGRLEYRDGKGRTPEALVDMAKVTPDPHTPPPWATRW